MDDLLGIIKDKLEIINKTENQGGAFCVEVREILFHNCRSWQGCEELPDLCVGILKRPLIDKWSNKMVGISVL